MLRLKLFLSILIATAFFYSGNSQVAMQTDTSRKLEEEPKHILGVDLVSPAFKGIRIFYEIRVANQKIGLCFPLTYYWSHPQILELGQLGGTIGWFTKFFLGSDAVFRPYLGPEVEFGVFRNSINHFSAFGRIGGSYSPKEMYEISLETGAGWGKQWAQGQTRDSFVWRISLNIAYKF